MKDEMVMRGASNVKGKSEVDDEELYQIESDVRTLKEAEMIKMDKTRMQKCMAMMDKEMQAIMNAKGKE